MRKRDFGYMKQPCKLEFEKEVWFVKRRILICVCVLLAVLCMVGVFAVQSSGMIGEEGLLARARKEIKNLLR